MPRTARSTFTALVKNGSSPLRLSPLERGLRERGLGHTGPPRAAPLRSDKCCAVLPRYLFFDRQVTIAFTVCLWRVALRACLYARVFSVAFLHVAGWSCCVCSCNEAHARPPSPHIMVIFCLPSCGCIVYLIGVVLYVLLHGIVLYSLCSSVLIPKRIEKTARGLTWHLEKLYSTGQKTNPGRGKRRSHDPPPPNNSPCLHTAAVALLITSFLPTCYLFFAYFCDFCLL